MKLAFFQATMLAMAVNAQAEPEAADYLVQTARLVDYFFPQVEEQAVTEPEQLAEVDTVVDSDIDLESDLEVDAEVEDLGALLGKEPKQKNAAMAVREKILEGKSDCDCKRKQLGVLTDTSDWSKAIEQVTKAANRPEEPEEDSECKKAMSRKLGELTVTGCLKDAVKEATEAASRPEEAAKEEKCPCKEQVSIKLGGLTDTDCLKEAVDHTKKAAARPEETDDTKGCKTLGALTSTNCLADAVKEAVKAASRPEEAAKEEDTCAEIEAEDEEPFEGIW